MAVAEDPANAGASTVKAGELERTFDKSVSPLLQKYCLRCHQGEKPKGEFNLTDYKTVAGIQRSRKEWLRVLYVIREEEMPPEDPLPTDTERRQIVDWLTQATQRVGDLPQSAGHVTIPRLSREEYRNTLRDLLGVETRVAATFTPDGEGQSGFNTDRDALLMTPNQIEKYLTAAERSLQTLNALRQPPMEKKLESEAMFMTETRETPKSFGNGFKGYVLNRGQMTLYDSVAFPADGVYEFRIRALSTAGPTGTRLRINDGTQGDMIVPATQPAEYSLRTRVERGSHQIAWNIQKPAPAQLRALLPDKETETPPAETSRARSRKQPPMEYRKLPAAANAIVGRESMKNASKYPATGTEPAEVARLIKSVDARALSVQRPYEWLRLLSTDGDPAEIVRFKGYVADRNKSLDRAKDGLAKALKETRAEFDARYLAANKERLQDNANLLERVKDIKVAAAKPVAPKPAAKQKPGSVAIDWIEVRGPLPPADFDPRRVFFVQPNKNTTAGAAAEQVIQRFARRAFRRPVSTEEVDRYLQLCEQHLQRGESFEAATSAALTAILVSPHFLYRVELAEQPPEGDEFPLNDHQLAARLSYFLWMSMPDDELFALADAGKLRDPVVLSKQVQRMLADDKARAFAAEFTGQWLGYSPLGETMLPDPKKFPEFNTELAEAMKQETMLTFATLLKENRVLTELLDSSETWLNEPLARHYGISGVTGLQMQRVQLKDRHRGGLLGMGSVLATTSSPTRTSPVLRGKWVLETLLGHDLPEPPADAGELPGDAGTARTLREELLKHRRNPSCAVCHNKIDPIGFGLESFDAIGRFRTKQAGKPIDTRGELPGGAVVQGAVELKQYLARERQQEFVENVTRRLLSFALGRQLQEFDEPVIAKIVATVSKDGYHARKLIEQIVLSRPFLYQATRLPAASE